MPPDLDSPFRLDSIYRRAVPGSKSKRESVAELILTDFCSRRGIAVETLSSGLKTTIVAVSTPFQLYVESLDLVGISKSKNPVDGLLATLAYRAFTSVCGSLSLVATRQLQEGEVVARAVVESAVNALYILQEDAESRLLQFFFSYIDAERTQNQRWRRTLATHDSVEALEHGKRIEQKALALDEYERFLGSLAAHANIAQPSRAWPKIDRLFQAIGRELDYRTVYAALCSQSHHDAEDVLNRFFVDSFENTEELSKRMRREKHAFSLYMILSAARYFLDNMEALGRRYDLMPVQSESQRANSLVAAQIIETIHNVDAGTFPKDWQGKLIDGI